MDTQRLNEDVLQTYFKSKMVANKVESISEWPDGIDGESIVQATASFAKLMEAEVLRRMQRLPGRPGPKKKNPEEA